AADHAGIEVVGAAGRVADIFVDAAVFVEIGRVLLRGGETRGPGQEQSGRYGNMILRKSHGLPRNALKCAGVPALFAATDAAMQHPRAGLTHRRVWCAMPAVVGG